MGAYLLAHDFVLQSLTCYTFDSGKRFSVSCKVHDLPPVNLRNLHLHLTKNPFASRPPHLCGVTLKTQQHQNQHTESAKRIQCADLNKKW